MHASYSYSTGKRYLHSEFSYNSLLGWQKHRLELEILTLSRHILAHKPSSAFERKIRKIAVQDSWIFFLCVCVCFQINKYKKGQ